MQFTNKETVDVGGAGRPDPGWHGKSLEGRREAAVQIRPEGEAQATPTPAEGTPHMESLPHGELRTLERKIRREEKKPGRR